MDQVVIVFGGGAQQVEQRAEIFHRGMRPERLGGDAPGDGIGVL